MANLIRRLNNDERAYRLARQVNRVRSSILNATDSPLSPGVSAQRTNEQIDALVTEYNGVLEEFINALNTDGLNFSSPTKETAAGTLLRTLTSLVNSTPPAGGGGSYNVAPPLDNLSEEELLSIIRDPGSFITFITQNKDSFIENQESRGSGGRLLEFYEEFFDDIIEEWNNNGSDSRAIYIIHTFLKIDSLTKFNVINGESFWFQRNADAIFNIRGLAGSVADALPFPGISGSDEETPEPLKGEEAIDFLLQKEQGILAALNEKIISEKLTKLDTAQNNILQISSEDTQLLINKIQRRTDLKEFFRIRSPYLSLIVPKIRLYKKVYVKEGDEYVLIDDPDFPNSRKEFKFKSFTNTKTIEDITVSGFGRGDGVGIKDLSWEYEGTNPETVNSFINFNISLFFQNLSDLIPRGANDSVFRDVDDTSLIQLIGAGIGVEDVRSREKESQTNTPFKFLIDAELGWTLSSQITEDLAADQSIDDIRSIIEDTSINLSLSLREHNINFSEDGTLTLDLSYFSSIDQVFTDNSMNILSLGRNTAIDEINAAEEQDTAEAAAEAQATRSERISRMDSDGCTTSRINSATVRNTEENETEEGEESPSNRDRALLAALRATGEGSILNNYSTIFRGLLNGAFNGESNVSKVYRLNVDASAVGLAVRDGFARNVLQGAGDIFGFIGQRAEEAAVAVAPGGRTYDQQADINEVEERQKIIERFRILQEFLGIEALRTLNASQLQVTKINALTGRQSNVFGGGEASADLQDAIRIAANEAETLQGAQQGLSEANLRQALELAIIDDLSDNNNIYTINFVRLGDIIDNIITGLKNEEGTFLNQQKDFFAFISGLYYYVDAIDGSRKAYNYCDMLISINSFRSFFIEKVIRQLKTKYTLKQFVIDLVKEFSYVQSLVAVSEETYVRQESRPAFSVFQGPDYDLEKLAFAQAFTEELGEDTDSGFITELSNDAIRAFRRRSVIEGLPLNNRFGVPTQTINYFTLMSTNFVVRSIGNTPSEDEDIERGIYHITIGADKGILKSINFRRDEIQGRREGRIVRAGALNFSALREKYDVTITTFGAPFFFPGMYFYLNPSMVGLGFPDQENSAARILGIGGYYFINKVSNRISGDGNFETTIEASWNSYGDGLDIDGCPVPEPIIIVPPSVSSGPGLLSGAGAFGIPVGASAATNGNLLVNPSGLAQTALAVRTLLDD